MVRLLRTFWKGQAFEEWKWEDDICLFKNVNIITLLLIKQNQIDVAEKKNEL